jgi:hypothetical protein
MGHSVTRPLANALEFAFGGHHTKLSRVFTIDGHSHKVCCKCGANFHYSLQNDVDRTASQDVSSIQEVAGPAFAKATADPATVQSRLTPKLART